MADHRRGATGSVASIPVQHAAASESSGFPLHQDQRQRASPADAGSAQHGGRAVVNISDPQGGRANYTFDLQWGGSSGGWTPGSPVPSPGHGPGPGGFPMARAIRNCQAAVSERLNRDGYSYLAFERTIRENNPGPHDRVSGTLSAKRRFQTTWFSFSCSVDFDSARVRHVDVRRR